MSRTQLRSTIYAELQRIKREDPLKALAESLQGQLTEDELIEMLDSFFDVSPRLKRELRDHFCHCGIED